MGLKGFKIIQACFRDEKTKLNISVMISYFINAAGKTNTKIVDIFVTFFFTREALL